MSVGYYGVTGLAVLQYQRAGYFGQRTTRQTPRSHRPQAFAHPDSKRVGILSLLQADLGTRCGKIRFTVPGLGEDEIKKATRHEHERASSSQAQGKAT